jgi:hypothetical protein
MMGDPLDPKRMTVRWLRERSDMELERLSRRWPRNCCRGHMIRAEQQNRSAEAAKEKADE